MTVLTPRTLAILFILLNRRELTNDNERLECLRAAEPHMVNGVVTDAILLNACVIYVHSVMKAARIPNLHTKQRPGFYDGLVSLLFLKQKTGTIDNSECVTTLSKILLKANAFSPIKRRGKNEAGHLLGPLTYEL